MREKRNRVGVIFCGEWHPTPLAFANAPASDPPPAGEGKVLKPWRAAFQPEPESRP